MKNLTLFFALLLCTSTFMVAQTTETTPITEEKKEREAATFKKGDIQLNAGIGIVQTYVADKNTTALMPPLSLTLGYRMGEHFMLSAFAGMTKNESYLPEQKNGDNWYVKNESSIVGLRAEFHTARRDNFNIYGGVMIGYNMPKVERMLLSGEGHGGELVERNIPAEDYDGPLPFLPGDPNAGKAIFTSFIGGSWYFTPKASIFGEVGYGISIATVGLGYKF